MLFPEKPFKSSPRLKSSPDSDYGPDYYPDGTLIEPSDMPSAQSSHQNLGIRNLVKDSIYKDTRDLSIRTSTKEAVNDHRYNYGDSVARFVEPPSSCNQGKSKGTMDVNESLRVLAKLRESSWNPSESGQQQRLSYDAPRFSYDGRESTSKLREMPRLSLDIKEGPIRTCEMDMQPKHSTNDEERSISSKEFNAEIQQEQPACKRLPSVVAKLMGLEELPEPKDSMAMTPHASIPAQERKQEPILIPLSLSSHNEPARRQQRILDATIRNVPNSKFPAETAPWKQQERIVLPRKLPKGSKGAHGKEQPAASVYSEIEKRLKDLDFQQSNKDLRALKQILDSMQAKGLLQNKKREEASMLKLYDENYNSQEVTDVNHGRNTSTKPNQMSEGGRSPAVEEESIAERFFKSPIVIMKPAKSADLGDEDSSALPLGGLSDLTQLRTVNSTDKKKISRVNRAAIEQHPKYSPRVPASQPLVSSDGKANGRNEVVTRRHKSSAQLMTESSSRKQQLPKDNNGSFLKHKNSTSTRSPQKKLDMERRARPPIPSIESNKNQRQSVDRSHLDTVSPRSKVRRKLAQGEDGHQNGAKSRTRRLNHPGDDMSTRSDGSISVVSELDVEVTSADRSAVVNPLSFQRGNETPPGRNPQKVVSRLFFQIVFPFKRKKICIMQSCIINVKKY
jgi:hypothetical protein